MSDELPRDPDLDDLPAELRRRHGPLLIQGRDPDTGELHESAITREQVASAFADARRHREAADDDAA